jgi:hypothetical protein
MPKTEQQNAGSADEATQGGEAARYFSCAEATVWTKRMPSAPVNPRRASSGPERVGRPIVTASTDVQTDSALIPRSPPLRGTGVHKRHCSQDDVCEQYAFVF